MTDTLPVSGVLSWLEWVVVGTDDIQHALAWSPTAIHSRVTDVMTRCDYGKKHTGQGAILKRGTPTCLKYMMR